MKKNKFLVLGMLIATFLLGTEMRAQEEVKPVYKSLLSASSLMGLR